jgi:ArsR family transcriptional regulator
MRKKSNQKTVVDEDKLEASSEVLRALAHPLRMRILAFIDKQKAINVNNIYNTLQLEQSITSQHLRILRLAGLVKTRREGKYVVYSVDYKRLGGSIAAVQQFIAD